MKNNEPEQIKKNVDIERKIIEKIQRKTKQDGLSLKALISEEIDKAGYLTEYWQKKFAQERIEDAVLAGLNDSKNLKPFVKESAVLPKKGLIDSKVISGNLIYIKCNHCGYIGKPYHWFFRTFCGVFYLVTIFNFIGALLYFIFTNPYICANCNERDGLVKILNDRKEIPIKSFTTSKFKWISIIFLLGGSMLLLRILY
ncbi:MAG: hypothetical protein NUV85_00945 [Candidatus Berkelbacteria bacterium]|nr:hypothetical protein [Candidatus Berkelbacteria bacterium]